MTKTEDDDDESYNKDNAYKESNFEPPDDESVRLDIEYQELVEILANLFSTDNLSLDNQNYPDFGNQISNTYYE